MSRTTTNYLTLLAIIFAGEIIFSLPFHITRFFRPTFLEVFNLSNTQLGDIFAVYGIVAMLAYFPGGVIADHFSARKLIVFSLITTALGGFYLYTLPDQKSLFFLFGFFGLTSILLFWAAIIKATREWGGHGSQGIAFGLLDGGRGLVASIAASVGVLIFSLTVETELDEPSLLKQGLQSVILYYSFLTLLAALFVWLLVEEPSNDKASFSQLPNDLSQVIRTPTVWLQGAIIVAAYCGYKALDNYGIYAVEVLKMNQVEAAEFTALGSYLRPIAAITAGFIADRFFSSRTIAFMFAVVAVAFVVLAFISPQNTNQLFILANLLITFAAVYGLRGVYFALVEESGVTLTQTGTVVGLVSLIGYTPDIFFAPITGRILDAAPGIEGFQHYFLLLSIISCLGIGLSVIFAKRISLDRTE
ncbi:MFS transporter [Aliikangiella marina]|uniref:MFS transporter n=1 Tax=Aliikangiella marina TaxID=1712262 RepID=UPI001AEEC281|nr:MFS transporter [Aliikangiella marina]